MVKADVFGWAIAVIRNGDRPEADCIFLNSGDRMAQADVLCLAIASYSAQANPYSTQKLDSKNSQKFTFLTSGNGIGDRVGQADILRMAIAPKQTVYF